MTRAKFNFIRDKWGLLASWAVWADAGDTPKSNMGNLDIFDDPKILSDLNVNVLFVGLNVSRGSITVPLSNFHDASPRATDFKTRFALKGSPLWGGYMTDIVKHYSELNASNVPVYLKENPAIEKENVEIFEEEIRDLESTDPTIIAFGVEAFRILKRNFNDKYRLLKIPHYANYTSKEKYREEVRTITGWT